MYRQRQALGDSMPTQDTYSMSVRTLGDAIREEYMSLGRSCGLQSAEKNPSGSACPDGVSSLCGVLVISVPCGFSKRRLPYDMQIMGQALSDAVALRAVADRYKTRTERHLQHSLSKHIRERKTHYFEICSDSCHSFTIASCLPTTC